MPFDFTEKAAVLLKRVAAAGGSLGSGLAKTAVELALREAYEQGKADASGATAPRVAPSSASVGKAAPRPASGPAPAVPAASAAAPAADCAHAWDEAFLDGRKVGIKCTRCGVLESDVQARCTHYFVQVGKQEICVACRHVRGGTVRS
jgi:hypothetical protein